MAAVVAKEVECVPLLEPKVRGNDVDIAMDIDMGFIPTELDTLFDTEVFLEFLFLITSVFIDNGRVVP